MCSAEHRVGRFLAIFLREMASPFLGVVSLSRASRAQRATPATCVCGRASWTESYLSSYCTPAVVVVTCLRYHRSTCVASQASHKYYTTLRAHEVPWGICDSPEMPYIFPLVWHRRRLTIVSAYAPRSSDPVSGGGRGGM